jgi:hypothetical protein
MAALKPSLFVAAMVLASSACDKDSDPATRAQRKATCPDLDTWAACAARQKATQERAEAERVAAVTAARAAVHATITQDWASYDALPKKAKSDLVSTYQIALARAKTLPGDGGQAEQATVGASARERMAPLIQPETATTGDGKTTLVPSSNAAKCRLWGAMWTGDSSTVTSLLSLGFDRVWCAPTAQAEGQAWKLQEAAYALDPERTCFLYGENHEEPVFVWQTPELFRKAVQVEVQTSDQAAMQMLALVSEGAQTVQPGARFIILDRGQAFVTIAANGSPKPQLVFANKWSSIGGYVKPSECHTKRMNQ